MYHAISCIFVFIITTGDIQMQITRKTEQYVITETKKNEFNQRKKAHIHGLSSILVVYYFI